MMPATSSPQRVLRRFQDARRFVLASTRVEYSTVGNIDAVAVAALLSPTFGTIVWIRFRPLIQGGPPSVPFEALIEGSNVVRGRIDLLTQVAADVITSWGQVVVEAVDALDQTCTTMR
jgi:hypothetical protein